MEKDRKRIAVLVLAVWVQPACLSGVKLLEAPTCCFLASSAPSLGSARVLHGMSLPAPAHVLTLLQTLNHITPGKSMAREWRKPLVPQRTTTHKRFVLRAGLGDAVKKMWPFNKN